MADIVEHVPKLTGIDAEIFLKNLERDITDEEIRAVRAWALSGSIQKFSTRVAKVEVKHCSECPFLCDTSFGNYCTKTRSVNIRYTRRRITNLILIPVWCPLPKSSILYPESGKEDWDEIDWEDKGGLIGFRELKKKK